jgi:DNA polymerase-1
MSSKSSTLIIDAYGFAFRAYHIQPAMSYNNIPVGCIYGFTSMLMKLINDFKPARAVVVFDHPSRNFRHNIYPEYKQHRPPVPEDLKSQLPILRQAAKALNFKTLEAEGLEADDVIASLAKNANFNSDRAIIVSSDKDLMQLVNDKIWMFDPVKQEYIKREEVVKKFGITPSQVVDFLAIVGDAADNVPGISGIGPKTATDLLVKYGSLQGIYDNFADIKESKRKQYLLDHKDNAFLSLELVKLKDDLEISWNNLNWSAPEGDQIISFLQQYGFKSLITRAQNSFSLQQVQNYTKQQEDLQIQIEPLSNWQHVYSAILKCGKCAILSHHGDLLLSYESNKIYQVLDLDFLRTLMLEPSILKITFDLKFLMHKLSLTTAPSSQDVMLMYYAISAGNKQLSLPDIVAKFFNINQNGYSINGYSCAFLPELYIKLQQELIQHKAMHLYYEIDLPLCTLLCEIETSGIYIDCNRMKELSLEFSARAKLLEERILQLSGKSFNVASAKQLGEILFEHLKLPGGKKTSSSQNYATDNDVLISLKAQGFEIAGLIIDWRHLTKLKNTYTDALPIQVSATTGKLHTTFSQTTTTTSRLSSLEPNLQNIPIRTQEGLMIRSAFVAPNGYSLISADYSQVELRIMAWVAGITDMKQAFSANLDIHASTASQVFNVSLDQVTSELRRKAKAINFGIIYGISPYGLAQNLGIKTQQADDYIKSYFARYPEIERYFETTKAFALKHGFVQNIFGRKCFIQGINDRNFYLRQAAQRAAINAPIQGACADITKIAMLNLHKKLQISKLGGQIILQIHDSILLIAPKEQANACADLCEASMKEAFAGSLDVPLVVDIKIASSWDKI